MFSLYWFYDRAQTGEYFIQNYLPKDYSGTPNNNGVAQDKDGLIYVANASGVLVYDGFNWQLIKLLDEIAVYSIVNDAEGKIYVGYEDGNFGTIEKTRIGSFYFTSLKDQLSEGDQPQETIRQILSIGKSVYFLSADRLIELKTESLKAFKPISAFHTRAFGMGKHLFVLDVQNTIWVLDNGILNPVKQTEELSKLKLFFNYKLNNTVYALGFRNAGIYKAFYDSLKPMLTRFENVECAANEKIMDSEINNGTLLRNGNFIVTSNKKGAFLLNKKLEVIKEFNYKNGIYDNNVKSCYQDANGNLWFSLFYGLSYVELNSQLFKYNRDNGISGVVQSAVYFQNKLYIANDKAVQVFNPVENKFIDLDNFQKQTWYLLTYSNKLFIATAKGIFIYNGKTITQVSESDTKFILNDPYQPDVLYAATNNGIEVYHLSGERLTFVKSHKFRGKVQSIASDKNRNIYFGTENNGIYYLNYSKSYLLDSIQGKDGLPNQNSENFVFTYNKKLFIGTESGLYTVKQNGQKRLLCIKEERFKNTIKDSEVFRAAELDGDLICSQTVFNGLKDKVEKRIVYINNSSLRMDNRGIGKLKDVKANLIQNDELNKMVFICTDEGLYLLSKLHETEKRNYNFFIHSVVSKKDTLLMNFAANKTAPSLITIPYENNELKVLIGSNCFEGRNNVEFSYYLDGLEDAYNSWTKDNKIIYSNLFEGSYTVRIKVKNELNPTNIIKIELPFKILPPWYRSKPAYTVYIILFIYSIYRLMQLNSKRLKTKNQKLENIIRQRTTVIEEQKLEVEHKHKEITDSINYAKRIQRALLATKELLDKYLTSSGDAEGSYDYFVFFEPKDVVSGDFYWAAELNNSEFSLVTADSTGHGVPGAIMSILNISCLNEAVKAGELSPDNILNYTRTRIMEHMANDGSLEGGKDGMDAVICNFDFKNKLLSFAAANNPLWIIRNNELMEFKPDKMPVGKAMGKIVPFTLKKIQMEKGDLIICLTDGFADQFGGINGKKYMYKPLKELLLKLSSCSLNEIKNHLKDEFETWKGTNEQVDDVLIIGIRV
ncbi:MAG: SpoIIE family protein phosphatase [Bacteroidetes bacterium]|nr:SpoIIE family protein phosphatase [Bacteroidota bacterium]